MLPELRKRSRKAGQPPGTLIYTGADNHPTELQVFSYNLSDLKELSTTQLSACQPLLDLPDHTTWVHVTGLSNTEIIETLGKHYNLHPLTIEDILNIEQRPKVEEFEQYVFVTLKMLQWHNDAQGFTSEQLSLVFGKDFLLSFQERHSHVFKPLFERLQAANKQRMRQQGSDYLAYRILDSVIDQYFVVLEGLGDRIERVENRIINTPTQKNARTLYKAKREVLFLRRMVWPMREAISHLLQDEGKFIESFTRVYLRDLYDHTVQAIDTIETFREMTSSILDMYLSSISNRMNEVIKVLTIISTVFIPITFISSFYGMNFQYMPELRMRYAYPAVIGCMGAISAMMLYYFRRKKWI